MIILVSSDYKTRLIKLKLLPLMYILVTNDIMFFITNLKFPTSSFNITNYAYFTFGSTWQAAGNKLQHVRSRNFYFYRLPRLWNALPIINYKLLRLETIKYKLQNYIYTQFEENFISSIVCTYSFLCPCSCCNKSLNYNHYLIRAPVQDTSVPSTRLYNNQYYSYILVILCVVKLNK